MGLGSVEEMTLRLRIVSGLHTRLGSTSSWSCVPRSPVPLGVKSNVLFPAVPLNLYEGCVPCRDGREWRYMSPWGGNGGVLRGVPNTTRLKIPVGGSGCGSIPPGEFTSLWVLRSPVVGVLIQCSVSVSLRTPTVVQGLVASRSFPPTGRTRTRLVPLRIFPQISELCLQSLCTGRPDLLSFLG